MASADPRSAADRDHHGPVTHHHHPRRRRHIPTICAAPVSGTWNILVLLVCRLKALGSSNIRSLLLPECLCPDRRRAQSPQCRRDQIYGVRRRFIAFQQGKREALPLPPPVPTWVITSY